MHGVVQTIRAVARDELEQRWSSALGVVSSLHGDDEHACTVKLRESGIVLPKVPIATGLIGTAALPAVGDLVLVVFASGDLHAPVVIGRLYDDEVGPPQHGPGETIAFLPGGELDSTKALQLAIKTPGDGSRSLSLVLDGTVKVTVDVDDKGVRIVAGEAKLELTQSGASDGKIALEVGGAKIVAEQSGDLTLEAQGKLKLKATEVEIAGDAKVKVTGAMVELN